MHAEPSRATARRLAVVVVLLAFAARVAACLILGIGESPDSDSRDYDQLAWSLARGEGYTIHGNFISFRAPLYPAFLSVVYHVAGHSVVAARLAQAALGALCVWLTFLLGRRLLGARRGLVAAGLYAVAPVDIFFAHGLLTETLYPPLLVAMAYGFVRLAESARHLRMGTGPARKDPPLGWLLLTGVLLGASILTRPVLLLFPPFLLLWAWWTYRRPRSEGGGLRTRAVSVAISAIILAALAVMSPWLLHVRERLGHWVTVTTGGGMTFWGANNVQVMDRAHWGRWVPVPQLPFYDELRGVAYDQVEVDRRAWRLGLTFLASNPDRIPRLLLFKFARFWNPVADVRTSWKIVYLLTYGLALPWMLAGLVMTWRRDEPILILHLLVSTFVLSVLVFWGDARMRSGISPFLWIFAVASFSITADRVRGALGQRP